MSSTTPTTRKELAARLADVELFAGASRSDLRIVARHMEIVGVQAGADIVVQGDEGDAFFLLLDGEARVRRNGRTIARLGPGDHFGELALLSPGPRNATVTATADATLGALHARLFNVILRDTSTLARRLLASLADRVRDLDRRLVG